MDRQANPQTRVRGFSLIEMLAVVSIFAMMAMFVLPNLGSVRARALGQAAERIAARLELARQRTIVTGVPHRLWIDIDDSSYRLEWHVSEDKARGRSAPVDAPNPYDPASTGLSLEPPRTSERSFHPVPGPDGYDQRLDSSLVIVGLDTPEGWIQRGAAWIAFDSDGTTVRSAIVLENDSGHRIALDVFPLADAVRIRDESV